MEKWIRARYLPGIPLGADGRRVTAGKEHAALSRRAAREGMVLLKNEEGALPLRRGCRVALFGKATADYVKGGGGSGDVTVPYVRNLYDGLAEILGPESVYQGTVKFYRDYAAARYAEGWALGMMAEPPVPEVLLQEPPDYWQGISPRKQAVQRRYRIRRQNTMGSMHARERFT